MTTPRDAIGLSDRLRDVEAAERRVAGDCDCRPEDTANWQYADTCREAATALDALQGEISQWANEVARYKAYAEKFDEENAALQARVKELEANMEYQARAHSKLVNELEEDRVSGWNRCREAESQRDVAKAAADTLRQQRDEAYERAAKVAEQPGLWPKMYRALDRVKIAAAIRRLAAGTEKEKRE